MVNDLTIEQKFSKVASYMKEFYDVNVRFAKSDGKTADIALMPPDRLLLPFPVAERVSSVEDFIKKIPKALKIWEEDCFELKDDIQPNLSMKDYKRAMAADKFIYIEAVNEVYKDFIKTNREKDAVISEKKQDKISLKSLEKKDKKPMDMEM